MASNLIKLKKIDFSSGWYCILYLV